MSDFDSYVKHFATITKHRHIVMKLMFKCGLYKRGLLHDLSKYGRTEFAESAKYFQGTRSPIEKAKEITGYSYAWQHHKGHNPHHWEYWIDNVGTYKNNAIEMPIDYVIEMICDWISASIVYSKNKCDFDKPYAEPFDYYQAHKHERIFHPKTQAIIEKHLLIIMKEGVNAFCKGVRELFD